MWECPWSLLHCLDNFPDDGGYLLTVTKLDSVMVNLLPTAANIHLSCSNHDKRKYSMYNGTNFRRVKWRHRNKCLCMLIVLSNFQYKQHHSKKLIHFGTVLICHNDFSPYLMGFHIVYWWGNIKRQFLQEQYTWMGFILIKLKVFMSPSYLDSQQFTAMVMYTKNKSAYHFDHGGLLMLLKC